MFRAKALIACEIRMAQPEGGGNDEERGHVAAAIDCSRRAPRHASPLSLSGNEWHHGQVDRVVF